MSSVFLLKNWEYTKATTTLTFEHDSIIQQFYKGALEERLNNDDEHPSKYKVYRHTIVSPNLKFEQSSQLNGWTLSIYDPKKRNRNTYVLALGHRLRKTPKQFAQTEDEVLIQLGFKEEPIVETQPETTEPVETTESTEPTEPVISVSQ